MKRIGQDTKEGGGGGKGKRIWRDIDDGRIKMGLDWVRYGGGEDKKGIGLGKTWRKGGGKGDRIGQDMEEGRRKRG